MTSFIFQNARCNNKNPAESLAHNTVAVKSEVFMVLAMKINITVFISITEVCNV
jgi:hypothetical protein